MPTQPKPKRVGRPALPKGEAKAETLRIRATPDDYKRLTTKAKAAKQTVSGWIRSTLEANLNA